MLLFYDANLWNNWKNKANFIEGKYNINKYFLDI